MTRWKNTLCPPSIFFHERNGYFFFFLDMLSLLTVRNTIESIETLFKKEGGWVQFVIDDFVAWLFFFFFFSLSLGYLFYVHDRLTYL
ncbi:uncharacterized protein EV154DRAFT_517772 [Mucor mucedo]|uniref:uncharacterized protein n=1 Tax=Mucor mucedo TaxID=29922 RepID=UPI0022201244|nr:uncharacterized protein EV154DRAFT_517772 [Mucor mucedo]KAI7888402.1 hypothetical protein EV154DRAFT_517772 [Mucor mucedo]